MVHFVGAGPGAPDLITQRGAALLRAADVVIYAGSLVNPALLGLCRQDCSVYNSAQMTLEQVLEVVRAAHAEDRDIVRLHTGDPCLYGAIREQMDALDALGIPYDDTPGVSSFCGAAAAAWCGIHFAGREPDGHHHAHGRAHARAGTRGHRGACRPWRHDGGVSFGAACWTACRPLCCRARTRPTPRRRWYKATWPDEWWCAAVWARWHRRGAKTISQNGAAAGGGFPRAGL